MSNISKQSSLFHAIALTLALIAIASYSNRSPTVGFSDRLNGIIADSSQELRQGGRSLRWHAQKRLPARPKLDRQE